MEITEEESTNLKIDQYKLSNPKTRKEKQTNKKSRTSSTCEATSKCLTYVWLEFLKRRDNGAEKIFEEIMSKYFPNLMKDKVMHLAISANPKQNKYEENNTLAYHSQIMKNPRIKRKSSRQSEIKDTLYIGRQ